jgi:hypothetical protein
VTILMEIPKGGYLRGQSAPCAVFLAVDDISQLAYGAHPTSAISSGIVRTSRCSLPIVW